MLVCREVACMIDEIFNIIKKFGQHSYGEDITQIQHALQCAELARRDDASDFLIAAALLHDVGQFLDDAGNAAEKYGFDARHEETGATYLARAFPEQVTEPIRLHVAAKRYLCTVEPAYREGLSGASELSLRLQGGPMDDGEVSDFRRSPYFEDALRLRRYDDSGKLHDWNPPELETYRPLLERLMTATN